MAALRRAGPGETAAEMTADVERWLFVRLTKIGGAEGDKPPSIGALMTAPLPATYWLEGWLVEPPRVGVPLCVLRVRNCVRSDMGLFVTTPLVAIIDCAIIQTRNSLWELIRLNTAEPPEGAILSLLKAYGAAPSTSPGRGERPAIGRYAGVGPRSESVPARRP